MAKPGVVFTKTWVVDFVLDLSGYTPDADLTSSCIIEPACGDGSFLRSIVLRLCASAKQRGRFLSEALKGCIRAYDMEPDSVARSGNLVHALLVEQGMNADEARALSTCWVQAGDFLLAEVPRAKWVVGNPPYIKASLIPRERRETYREGLSCVTMGSDLYVGFFQKGLTALAEDGTLCFICADRWLQNRYGSRLREFVSKSFSLDVLVRMHEVDAFQDEVSAYPAVSLIKPGAGRPMRYIECSSNFLPVDVPAVQAWLLSGKHSFRNARAAGDILPPLVGSGPVPLATPERLKTLEEISKRHPLLEDAGVRLGIGVATGCDEVYVTQKAGTVEDDRELPLFVMRDWRAGRRESKKYLVNPWNEDGTLVNLDDYPRLKQYLENNAERLKRRRVAKDHPDAWYRTLDKPDFSLMGKEMLLFPDMAAKSDPVYTDGSRYPHHNCYWMTSGEWDVKALGGLMMSDIVEGYVDAFGVKMRGSTLRFQAQYLRKVHIPRADSVDERIKSELAEAFETRNRERANAASRKAYGMETRYAG